MGARKIQDENDARECIARMKKSGLALAQLTTPGSSTTPRRRRCRSPWWPHAVKSQSVTNSGHLGTGRTNAGYPVAG